MKRFYIFIFLLISSVVISNKLSAQLLVDNSLTAQQLAQLISGQGVQILNPQVHCAATGYGKYNATNSNLNITEGLLLTTGTINNAIGPNNVGNKTTYFGAQNTPSTYPLLNSYTGRTTWEYCEFEFDIVPQGDTIKFDFVFASEEYEEWVGSQYNDVFGFFISGPGIVADAGAAPYHNIALIPNTSTAVTINNVNQNSYTQYYQNNNNGTSVQYDGFTRGLTAISQVQPCQTYHLKLVVADVSDKLWDSGVFIEKIRSNNILLLSQTAGGIPNMVEGCNYGSVSFTRQTVTNQPLTVQYWLAGTATNGTDYPQIGASPNPLSPKTITIPANQATASINIDPYQDGVNEGLEYLTVYLGNPYCSNSITDSLRFYIQDSLFTTVAPILDSICIGQSVQLTTTGGGSAFSWLPISGLTNAAITNPIATPTATTTYTLTTTASNCIKSKTSTIYVSDISLALSSTNVTCNGSNNGLASVIASGGFAPYTYSWTGPSGFTSSTSSINNLMPGTYSVTVTGRRGCSKNGTIVITEPTTLTTSVSSPTYNGGYNISCNGAATGAATVVAAGGTVPYTYVWAPTGGTNATASNLTAGTYTVTVTDNKGCVSTKTITLSQPLSLTASISSQTNVLCFSNSTGAATVSVSGGTLPYTYSWNSTPIQTASTATNLAAGTYTVIIRDANNCSTSTNVSITQPAAALSSTISSQTNVLCRGNATGSAAINTLGGTLPYSYSWNTTPIQTAATAINLQAGNYVATVTDANLCQTTVPVTITQPATNLSATITSQTNVLCFGNATGAASVNATGGTPGYTYSWTTSPVQTTSTASGLTAGTYACTVRDLNSCSFTVQAVITQPSAVLSSSISSQTNVLCRGNATGVATISSIGGTAPYSYSWTPTGGTASTATNLTAGTYTCTVRDANNCTNAVIVSITQPATIVSSSLISQQNVLCFGASTGSATITASGGVTPYTYSWSPSGGLAATATNLVAGTYTCTVRDANNCTAIVAVAITQPSAALSSSIATSTNVLCRNNATGAATVNATGGSGSYSYSWNSVPVQTTPTASGLAAGNYTVTVTDNNGCVVPVTSTVSITQPAAVLSATSTSPLFNGNNISCNAGTNGSINLSPTGGTALYTFAWTGPGAFVSTTEDITGLIAGTYSVTITDAHACTSTHSKTLTQPAVLDLTSSVTNATCPAFTNGAINITVTGGTTPYTFSWSGPSAFSATTEDISGLASGNYTVTITDANGCTKISTITVTQPSSIVVTNTTSMYTGGHEVSCYNGNNGSINVTVVGGTPFPGPSYSYLWTGPGAFTSTSQNINTLIAGTYQVVVTDQAGCNASKTIVLTQPNAITSTLTPSIVNGGYNVTCNGASTGTISLVGTGGTPAYTYSWSGPGAFNSSLQNITSLSAGTYSVTVTDANSCTGTNTLTLTQPAVLSGLAASPTVAGGVNVSCNGAADGTINLTVSGGTTNYSYAWTGPASYSNTTEDLTALVAGSYSVTITDANSCTATTTVTLTQPSILTAVATSPTVAGGYNITCNGTATGAVNLLVNGGTAIYSYAWTGPNGYTATTQNLNSLSAGTYSVVVTDVNNCTTSTSITLTEPPVLSASASSFTFVGGNNISCNGVSDGSIALAVSGGTTTYTYAWTGPASFSTALQNPTSLIAGTYSVVVTDANNCTTSTTILLTEPAILSATANSPTVAGGYNITCNGLNNGSINLNTTGGITNYSYAWSGPSLYSSTSEDISSLTSGTYTVVVTDANSCTATTNITLTEPAVFAGSVFSPTYIGGNNISCNGNSDGSIDLTHTGGTAPYSYNWSNGTSLQDLTNVTAGNYSVIVTDANNCSFNQSIILIEPAILVAAASSPTVIGGYNINCNGNSNGSIELGVGGGITAYTYAWTGPSGFTATTEDLSGLVAGSYNVLVTDVNTCTATTTIVLTEPTILSVALSSGLVNGGYNISCNGNADGTIASSVAGGTPLYTYSWNGPSGFTSDLSTLSGMVAGSYTLTVTDTNSCSTNSTIVLTEPAILSATAASTVYAGGYNISCNGLSDGTIALTLSGGTSSYNFNWSGPNGYASTSQNISGLAAGVYSVEVTDANNCTFSLTQTLSEPLPISDSIIASSFVGGFNISCFGAQDGTINLIENGGATPYTQTWNGPNGFTSTATSLSALDIGTYTVLITDANGCAKVDSTTLIQPINLTTTLTSPSYVGGMNIKCNGDSTAVVTNVVTGGTQGYAYSWTGPNGFVSNNQGLFNVGAGTYNLAVTDTNGCLATSAIVLTEATQAMTGLLTPSLFVGGTNISCLGLSNGEIDLSFTGGTPGYTFWWRGPDSLTFATEDIFGLVAGDYDVVVTDTNGCQLALAITLSEPTSAFTDSISTSLFNGNVNVSCYGLNNGAIDLFLNGGVAGYSYNWTGPNGFTASTQDLNNLIAGNYLLIVSDTNGCSIQDTVLLVQPDPIQLSAVAQSYNGNVNVSCFGSADGAINLNVVGGISAYSYAWSGPMGYVNTIEDINGLIAGAYTVVVSDTNNCIDSISVNLIEPQVLSSSVSSTPATCAAANGSADLTVNGGVTPYAYLWSNSSTSEDLFGVVGNTYFVNVVDANNCIINDTVLVNQISLMSVNALVNNVLCYGNSDGSINLSVTNGTEPYVFNWSNGAVTEDLTTITAGSYTVTITDAFGCSIIDTFDITQSSQIVLNLTPSAYTGGVNVSSYQGSDGTIDLTVSGGNTPYVYSWSNSATTEDIDNVPAGFYSVIVTDSAGCSAYATLDLIEPLPLQMPTGISPNGDGKNDLFVVHGLEIFPNNHLTIFNRWGNIVYQVDGYQNKWDGTNSSGDALPAGTYFVILEINNKEIVLKGYVDIRRD